MKVALKGYKHSILPMEDFFYFESKNCSLQKFQLIITFAVGLLAIDTLEKNV